MNIDEAIVIVNELKEITQSFKVNCNLQDYKMPDAIETLINEYNNLKQIEEAHRIENGELRRQIRIKDEYCDLLQMTAVDYDEIEDDPQQLKQLIDQVADYAVKAINCDTTTEIWDGNKNILKEKIKEN